MFDGNDPFSNDSYAPQSGPNMMDYTNDAKYYAGQGGKLAQMGLTKAKPFIILGIIGFIILIAILFYLGLQQSVTFNISEYGGSTTSARLTISTSNGIIYGPQTAESHTTTLMPGTYNYSVTSGEYQTYRDTFTVPLDDPIIQIDLEKDIEANLNITSNIEKIYAKQELNGIIIIDNVTTTINNEKLIASDTKGLLDITFDQSTLTINSGNAKSVGFIIKVKSTAKLKNSEETIIKLGIKGTRINDSFAISVNPTINPTFVKLSGTNIKEATKTISDLTLKAGEFEKPIIITIENSDKTIDLENLYLEITPDSSSADKISWFEFLNYQDTPEKILIETIGKGEKTTVTLKITVPITANVDDEFKGKLILRSDSLATDKEYTANFRVSESKKVLIELSKTSLSTNCTPDGCESINLIIAKMNLENNGNTDITNVLIETEDAQSYALCPDWFDPQSKTVEKISSKDAYPINMILTPTYQGEPGHVCYLKITYDNPITQQRKTELSDPIIVNLNYKE
jgi:hypothetical protein